jgi:DNA repair protein RadD
MLDLTQAIARLGEERLTSFLGYSTVELIRNLDIISLTSVSLAKFIIQKFDAQTLLLEKEFRNNLFESLKRSDAEYLCDKLALEIHNPWESLKNTYYSVSSKSTEILFWEFGIFSESDNPNISSPDLKENSKKEIMPSYPLFEHQQAAVNKVLSNLNSNSKKTLLHMPTGSGKTRTAMNVISTILRESENSIIIWLAYSEELCEQAAQEFENSWSYLGNRNINIYRNFGPNRWELNDISEGFLVTSLNLIYRSSFSQDRGFFSLISKVKLVVFDEAHMAIAETYKHVLNLLITNQNTAFLGLTATPGRSWLNAGEDLKLAQFFDHNKVILETPSNSNPIEYLQQEGYLSQIIREPLFYNGSQSVFSEEEIEKISSDMDLSETTLKTIGEDQQRNIQIIHRILSEVQEDSKIIVFACSVEHAEMLASVLFLKGINAKSVTSKTKMGERKSTIDDFLMPNGVQILTNFGVLTTGFDAPKANIAIIARPTKSVILYGQMMGRVTRGPRAGGTNSCKVVTVVDQVLGFRDLSESFSFWEDIWETEGLEKIS